MLLVGKYLKLYCTKSSANPTDKLLRSLVGL